MTTTTKYAGRRQPKKANQLTHVTTGRTNIPLSKLCFGRTCCDFFRMIIPDPEMVGVLSTTDYFKCYGMVLLALAKEIMKGQTSNLGYTDQRTHSDNLHHVMQSVLDGLVASN